VRVTHIGGPTVLIEAAGWRILTDPTFDKPGRRYRFGWGTASVKTTGPAVPVSELGPIDAVLLTHDHHGDNLDTSGRELLAAVPTVLTTPSGARRLRTGTGLTPTGLKPWATTTLTTAERTPIEVTATPCRHGPPLSRPVVGDVTGFALRWDGQRNGVLWISGDTVLYRGVRAVAGRLPVGVAVLHLGGVRFPITGPVRYTMTARDVVALCRTLRPDVVVPVHYEGWRHFQQTKQEIRTEFATAPDLRERVQWLPLGAPVDLSI
jgi:L-ascorbate metabolism protein UlaG (beta-lactamase superfamily)